MSKDNPPHSAEEPREPIEDLIGGAEPAASGPVDPQAKLQAERDELRERLDRALADYQNYQKRSRREIEQERQFANEQLVKSLLPILDDMERALEAARENHGEDDPFYQGMQLVHDNTLRTLGQFGLSVISAEGEFDPERYTAMMRQPTADVPAGTVVQELQRGYELKGRILRPAAVIVAVEPEPEDGSAENQSGG